MSVISACTRLSMRRPMPTIICARRRASTCRFMNAPEPTFTSSTSASRPTASFFDMMEDAIKRNGFDGGGGIAQRVQLAVGGRHLGRLADEGQADAAASCARNSSMVRLVRKPGMDSSLSSVPPVWPSARPEIMGTMTPAAAASGAAIRLVLSPTPPVECLSTLTPGMEERSTISPDCSHAVGEGADFAVGHAGEKDGHQERGSLIVGDGRRWYNRLRGRRFLPRTVLRRPACGGSGRQCA